MTQPRGPEGLPAQPVGGPPPPGAPEPTRTFPPPPPGPPARPSSGPGRLGLLAVGISALALVLALGSAVFAWRAIDQAKDAKAIAIGQGGTSPAAPGAPEAPTAAPTDSTGGDDSTPTDASTSPGAAPVLNERTVYEPKYEKQSLTLKAAACHNSMYVDVDEPRTQNDETGAEFKYTVGCGGNPSVFRLEEGVEGSDSSRPGMKPQDCADVIRTALIGADAAVPVRKGTTFCVTTDYAAARERGDRWRMALVEVVGVANDGTATIQVTAWDIPD